MLNIYVYYNLFRYIMRELILGTFEDVVNQTYSGPVLGDSRHQLFQITNGLAHMHKLGCVHRDLNPSNIQVSLHGNSGVPVLKLSNFGLSRVLGKRQGFSLWKSAECELSYMSPEVHDSDQFTSSMDVFSLGCLWTLRLCGFHPFGSNKTAIDRIKKKKPLNLLLKNFKNVEGEEAQQVFALVMSMLSFIPEQRPAASDILKHSYFTFQLVKEEETLGPSTRTAPQPKSSPSLEHAPTYTPLHQVTYEVDKPFFDSTCSELSVDNFPRLFDNQGPESTNSATPVKPSEIDVVDNSSNELHPTAESITKQSLVPPKAETGKEIFPKTILVPEKGII